MKKKTTQQFIKESKEIHGEIYDYSLTKYSINSEKVKIICPIHGIFYKTPAKHLSSKQGCPKCAIGNQVLTQRKNQDVFINQCREIHGDKYDYSLVNYKGNKKKIKIICPTHGEFTQLPHNHISGKGCKYCGGTAKLDTKQFIIKSKEIHGDKYDYSKVEYVNTNTPVLISCKEHGEFYQLPNNHLSKKQGCYDCLGKIKTTEGFIRKSKEIHGEIYDYSKVEYVNTNTPVTIMCPDHGEFLIQPSYHLQNGNCPECKNLTNIMEDEIRQFINSITSDLISNDRTILNGKEIDIYIPSKNIGIEFNGLYWHSDLFINKDYHLNKTEECEKKGINLIHIFEDEWIYKKDIVKSRLKNILGVTPTKLYARNCVIKEVTTKTKTKFLKENHIQGAVGSNINIGLYYNNELVSLMTFGNRPSLNKYQHELIRFCNKINTTVIGGASRLLKYFLKTYNPKEIISYADRRWSMGVMYDTLGFKFIENTKPNFFYFKNKIRENRIKYQKHKLIEMGYDKTKTESQIMSDIGFNKIYDCGNKKYVYKP